MPQKLLKPSAENIPEVTTVSIRTLKDSTSMDVNTPSLLINCAGVDYVRLNLLQDCILGFTGATKDGQQIVLGIIQGGPSPWRIGFLPSIRLGSDIFTAPELSTTTGKLDRLIFMYDIVSDKYDLVGYSRGY